VNAAQDRDLIFWAVLGSVVVLVWLFVGWARLLQAWRKRRGGRLAGVRGRLRRLGRWFVSRVHCHHCEEVRQLRTELQTIAIKNVQLEACRAQFVLLCDQARDHVQVLAAVRAELESFAQGWDLIPDTFQGVPGRHGTDSETSRMPAVPGQRPSGWFETKSDAAPTAY